MSRIRFKPQKTVSLLLLTILFLCGCQTETTPTPTPTAVATSTPTAIPTPPPTSEPTPTPTPTSTPTSTPTWYLRTETPIPLKTVEPYVEPTATPKPTIPPKPTPSPTPKPTPTPSKTVDPTVTDPILRYMSGMTLEEKVGQMFIVAPEQLVNRSAVTEARTDLPSAVAKYHIGGLIYFESNIKTRSQVISLLAQTSAAASVPLFQCVDEEGGMVTRIAKKEAMGTTAFPNMFQINEEEDAYQVGKTIGAEIKVLGFNVDFAPVADVMTNPKNRVIGERSFSTDPEIAAKLVSAAVRGFQDSGIISCLKHFPGHGNTTADSHSGFAVSEKTMAELEACELLPFVAGIDEGVPMVMSGHISLPSITGDETPASLSHDIVTEILRQKLGFDGLCITDSLQMGAVTKFCGSTQAAVASVLAGNDIILMPTSFLKSYQAVLAAVNDGIITEERIDQSVYRILKCKAEYGIWKEGN